MKTAFQKKKEAKQQAALELHKTKARLGLGPTQPLRGATPSALAATTSKRKVTPPANLRPHPGFGTGQRPHACSQVEARSRGDGGNREGDSQEGGSDCPGLQQWRSAIPAGWKRQLSRLSDDLAACARASKTSAFSGAVSTPSCCRCRSLVTIPSTKFAKSSV